MEGYYEFMDWRTISLDVNSTQPNLIYRFNVIPTKISASLYVDINKLILKFIWKGKRPKIANTVPEKLE